MSVEPEWRGLVLAAQVTAAFEQNAHACAAELAQDAAEAFLAEQGEPSFDAPNMLRLRVEALLELGDHGAAAASLDRAQALAQALPAGDPFDRLRVQLGRLRGQAPLAAGDRPGARAALQEALERCEAALGPRISTRRRCTTCSDRRQVLRALRRRRRALCMRDRDLRVAWRRRQRAGQAASQPRRPRAQPR